jgi:hypothetical protein
MRSYPVSGASRAQLRARLPASLFCAEAAFCHTVRLRLQPRVPARRALAQVTDLVSIHYAGSRLSFHQPLIKQLGYKHMAHSREALAS